MAALSDGSGIKPRSQSTLHDANKSVTTISQLVISWCNGTRIQTRRLPFLREGSGIKHRMQADDLASLRPRLYSVSRRMFLASELTDCLWTVSVGSHAYMGQSHSMRAIGLSWIGVGLRDILTYPVPRLDIRSSYCKICPIIGIGYMASDHLGIWMSGPSERKKCS